MNRRPKPPGWNAVFLIGALALALWLFAKVLAAVWPWLLGVALVVSICWALIQIRRRNRGGL